MTPQTPAQGISAGTDYGTLKSYRVNCTCTDATHDHQVWIACSADDMTVDVTTYLTMYTRRYTGHSRFPNITTEWLQSILWTAENWLDGIITRVKLTKDIWWSGTINYEASLVMSKQQTMNYISVLESALSDVQTARAQQTAHTLNSSTSTENKE
jgi:hypothetical protein